MDTLFHCHNARMSVGFEEHKQHGIEMSEAVSLLRQADRREVLTLFRTLAHVHQHLDWQSLDAWLDDSSLRCWTSRRGEHIQALLGATLEGAAGYDRVAWLRFAISARRADFDPALDVLWHILQSGLADAEINLVGLLAIEEWIESYAQRWHFVQKNAVITLRRDGGRLPTASNGSLVIRPAAVHDLDTIVGVDQMAFGPLWAYSRKVLDVAALQADLFTVAQIDDHIVGYLLSTRYSGSGHLARLAVLPENQGHGIGAALVINMLHHYEKQGIRIVTVNTQSDNRQSYRLYSKLGFTYTGHRVPVWLLEL